MRERSTVGSARSLALLALGIGLAVGAGHAAAQERTRWLERYERAATYDAVVSEDVMMPMRDGVRLATRLYFPARAGQRAAGRFPVLLVRSMADTRRTYPWLEEEARYFATRGYVVANQTMRGRPPSEGEHFYLYGRQHEDGADAVEWLATRPWSAGRVGTFGVSHMGVAQYSLATERPEGLAAMVPAFAHSNYALWSLRTGGALELRYLNWATGASVQGNEVVTDPVLREAARIEREKFREYLLARPPFLFEFRRTLSPVKVAAYEDWLLSVVEHSEYPAEDGFWSDPGMNLTPYYGTMADVPTLHHSGWYDTYPRAKSDNWIALAPLKQSPQWLMLGPWPHVSGLPRWAGDVDFGPAAEGDYNRVRLAWFDRWLKDMDTGVEEGAPVKVFVMGGGDERRNADGRKRHGGFWRESASWPLAETRYERWYLRADGSLSTEPEISEESATTYTFDPRDPVPTIGGNISAFSPFVQPGAFDQVCGDAFIACRDDLPLASRPDVLVFQTPPLQEDVEVTGYIAVRLHVSSTGVDTDFTAKLIDVHPPNADYPNGYAMNIADGIIRARFRNGREREELMVPGEVYEVLIEPYPTANVFKKGHRIRLDISSSNYPRFDINPNTGEPILRHRRFRVVDNTIHHDRTRPSHIVLPVIPAGTPRRTP